jgi:eukaryotic-like serine/threonine-protein kinase
MINNLGRYEIIGELGRGAMGVVYKARDPLIDRLVAIKTINLQSLPPEKRKEYEARFYQEAKAAGRLSHPNIITIHDLGETHGIAYIAMELLEGRELQNLIEEGRHLSVDEALNIAIQVAVGLGYAHEHGVVHRDIKPSNIMVLQGKRVKIADFGIARMQSSLLSTQTGMVMGSPLYMSPEQVKSERVDFRSDIFSLGIVLYQMLTGKLPFGGDNAHTVMYQIVQEEPPKPSSLNSDVPDSLDTIVAKCLAKSPVERYQDANELGKALLFCYQSSHTHTGHYLQSLLQSPSTGKISKWKIIGIGVLAIILFEVIEELFFRT